MTSHANCTHEKTKAARALCRTGAASGRTHDEQRKLKIEDNATASRRAMIREKAAKASSKLGEPKAEGEPAPQVTVPLSGFCGIGNHDKCPGGGKQWSCGCECHS